MSRLRVAVIGLGPAAEPHARALLDLAGEIEVVAAVTRSAARAEAFAKRFALPVSTDLDGVIADRSIAAAIVLTPPNTHLDVSLACFTAGKHVLVEKPLETTLARAEALVEASRAAGRCLGVVLQNRFRTSVARLGEILTQGGLGEIAFASVQVPWWRPQSYYDEPGRGAFARDGGGVLITQAIHTLDIFRALVGVSRIDAARLATTSLHRMESEDYADALVTLGNGSPGTIIATTAAFPGGTETISITGSRGGATLAGSALQVRWLDGRTEDIAAEGGTGSGANIMDFPHENHRRLIADFAGAVRNSRPPRVSGEEALATQRLIEELMRPGKPSSAA